MIQGRVLVGLHRRLDRARLRLGGAIHDARDACVNHRPHAHLTRFDRHIQRGAGQSIVARALRRRPKRDDLSVGGRIGGTYRLIAPCANDFVVQDDDGANRYFAAVTRLDRLFERCPHESFIMFDGHDSLAEPSRTRAELVILPCREHSANIGRERVELMRRSTNRGDHRVKIVRCGTFWRRVTSRP